MFRLFEKRIRAAIQSIRDEAKHREETTPSDVSVEAFNYAAKVIERELDEALRQTERLTPEQYGELHGGVTAQTVTRWIRLGQLEAEEGPNGYLISRDAVRVEKHRKAS